MTDGLTSSALEALLGRLAPDREEAGRHYERLRRRLVRLFDWRGCSLPDALADETMDRVARRLAEGVVVQAPDPTAYVLGVARLVFVEVARRTRAQREALAEGRRRPAPEEGDTARDACLQRCLGTLAADARDLILRYHEGDGRARIDGRSRLGSELGLAPGALRLRAHRIRDELGVCLRRCLTDASRPGPGFLKRTRPGRHTQEGWT